MKKLNSVLVWSLIQPNSRARLSFKLDNIAQYQDGASSVLGWSSGQFKDEALLSLWVQLS